MHTDLPHTHAYYEYWFTPLGRTVTYIYTRTCIDFRFTTHTICILIYHTRNMYADLPHTYRPHRYGRTLTYIYIRTWNDFRFTTHEVCIMIYHTHIHTHDFRFTTHIICMLIYHTLTDHTDKGNSVVIRMYKGEKDLRGVTHINIHIHAYAIISDLPHMKYAYWFATRTQTTQIGSIVSSDLRVTEEEECKASAAASAVAAQVAACCSEL